MEKNIQPSRFQVFHIIAEMGQKALIYIYLHILHRCSEMTSLPRPAAYSGFVIPVMRAQLPKSEGGLKGPWILPSPQS